MIFGQVYVYCTTVNCQTGNITSLVTASSLAAVSNQILKKHDHHDMENHMVYDTQEVSLKCIEI